MFETFGNKKGILDLVEKEWSKYPDFEKKIVEVCSSCHTASCWYGEFLCNDSQHSSTEKKAVRDLRKVKSEHEENWSDKKMMKVYGEPSPFGFID